MNKRERITVYVLGFILGSLLVSAIMARRAAQQNATAEDPWLVHNREAEAMGAEPLPSDVPPSMVSGKVMAFGQLPSEAEPLETVWVLNFDNSYPFVRIVRDNTSAKLAYMAADQVLVHLPDTVDVTALQPALDQLGLRLRMFNRKERIAVVGVLDTALDAVPRTIEALRAYPGLDLVVEPDLIRFR